MRRLWVIEKISSGRWVPWFIETHIDRGRKRFRRYARAFPGQFRLRIYEPRATS